MAEDLKLTARERKMILDSREEQKRVAKHFAEKRQALQLAADYEAWLQDNGRGSTFSTFVNEFGYDEIGAGEVFRRVESIRDFSHKSMN